MTDPWANDRLQRRETGEHLIEVLLSRYTARKAAGQGSYILNIDASWGQGKTFFLECLRADLQERGHIVGYVNAWQDDHANDPLVTVMSAIEQELTPHFAKNTAAKAKMQRAKTALSIVAGEATKQVGLHLLKLGTGIAADKIVGQLREAGMVGEKTDVDDKELDKASDKGWETALKKLIPERVAEHQRALKSSEEFRAQVSASLSALFEKGSTTEPMFVFVDELDRCRPLYAIKLLEDLKHLFAIKGIVFVVATDSAQLSHSVRAIYGAEFEARKYLRRFFDRVFVFPEAARSFFINHLLESHDIDVNEAFYATGGRKPLRTFVTWADSLGLSNRDLEQCMEIISTFVTSWEHKAKIDPVYLLILVWLFYSENVVDLERTPIAPHAAALKRWSQIYEYTSQEGAAQRATRTGDEMLQFARTAAAEKLIKTRSHFGSTYQHYLFDERIARYGPQGSMGLDTEALSVLSEYPSRVRNAGRVIEAD